MPPRARSLSDGHDRVDGAVVGSAESMPAPDPGAGDWGRLRLAEDALRECVAVVSYVATAEERHGFPDSAAHYRRLAGLASEVLPDLHRLAVGASTLPFSLLDEVRLGIDRLVTAVEVLSRVARPSDFAGAGDGR